MHRSDVFDSLALYQEAWSLGAQRGAPFVATKEMQILGRILDFVRSTPAAFDRATTIGHLTGSALVVSPDLSQVLLTLHRKLGKWLQLGGHADGHPLLHEVAMREAGEESGLSKLQFLAYETAVVGREMDRQHPLPFDFDCHEIPEHPGEPAHVHYDARYLIVADPDVPLVISAESRDLRWFDLAQAREAAPELSMMRQFDKLDWLRSRLVGDSIGVTEIGSAGVVLR